MQTLNLRTNQILECDVNNGWKQLKWGSEQACFKYIGLHAHRDGAAACRAVGGQLPLPRNDVENEDFQNPQIVGKLLDATDLDGDGIWHDSYGNEVTYFAPLWYYPHGGKESLQILSGGPWTYNYMSGDYSKNINPQPEYADFVWTVYPNLAELGVTCQIPLAPPKPPAPEPPTPIKGKIKQCCSSNRSLECDWRNEWYQHRWGTGQACFKYIGYRHYDEAAAICREEGASLPLPKNDAELESFRTGFAGLKDSGLIIDASDSDEDGVWEDSYGNVVTYFAPLHYYPSGQKYSVFNYRYMAVIEKEGDLLSYVVPNEGFSASGPEGTVFCQKPLDPPIQPVFEPPAPVKGKIKVLTAKLFL